MQPTLQTPGVYIVEQNAFPTSVVEVATAVPAFIGYTQRAARQGQDLTKKPTRISSLQEFEDFFGGAFRQTFNLRATAPDPAVHQAGPVIPITFNLPQQKPTYYLTSGGDSRHYLYQALQLFYLNGGATCYILSIGDYDAVPATGDFTAAIDLLLSEAEPTLLLCPDALRLHQDDYHMVLQHMLAHCGVTQSRMALFDVYQGAVTQSSAVMERITAFRESVGQHNLPYGACYFPWGHTSLLTAAQVSFMNLSEAALRELQQLLAPAAQPGSEAEKLFAQAIQLWQDNARAALSEDLEKQRAGVDQALRTLFPDYARLLDAVTTYLNTAPVAPALAGIYTAVDSSRGVWKAPANVSLHGVEAPTVALSNREQESLNVDVLAGKSVNVIRSFPGVGPLVWGARTLDGNSQDWRYVNVRRTMIMLEQSIKLALRGYTFAPNDANTWVTIRSMLESFLFNLWKQGALAGAAPEQAYSVRLGLGSTMTADDILAGNLNVTVLVAIVRPAEFIVLTLQQQMQTS